MGGEPRLVVLNPQEPLCAAGTTIGLSVEACRFNFHSPEKSGFCCAMTLMTPARTRGSEGQRGIVGLPLVGQLKRPASN